MLSNVRPKKSVAQSKILDECQTHTTQGWQNLIDKDFESIQYVRMKILESDRMSIFGALNTVKKIRFFVKFLIDIPRSVLKYDFSDRSHTCRFKSAIESMRWNLRWTSVERVGFSTMVFFPSCACCFARFWFKITLIHTKNNMVDIKLEFGFYKQSQKTRDDSQETKLKKRKNYLIVLRYKSLYEVLSGMQKYLGLQNRHFGAIDNRQTQLIV